MTDWLALADECEQGTRGQYALLREVAGVFGYGPPRPINAPLDAMVTLIKQVRPDLTGIMPLDDHCEAWVWVRHGNSRGWRATAPTPALSLCAAFCRAMAASQYKGDK